jgi:hypothetical protein
MCFFPGACPWKKRFELFRGVRAANSARLFRQAEQGSPTLSLYAVTGTFYELYHSGAEISTEK